MTDTYVRDAQRVAICAARLFEQSGRTGWPTFAEVARSTRVPMKTIEEMCDEGINKLMRTAYDTSPPQARSKWFVEIC